MLDRTYSVPDDADDAITVSGLTKRYGSATALDGLDLEVPRGAVFGFLGPNGAGKTTLMRILVGLAKATSGHAVVLGHDVSRDSVAVRRKVGYLAQLPRFYDELTVRQTLRFARGFFPFDADDRVEDDIDEAIDLVGLVEKSDARVGTLSGGQRQRVGIAQACVHRPELLLLDEPAAALDPVGRRDVLAIMRRLRGTTTVFYSTHILDDVERVSDLVAVIDRGRRVVQQDVTSLLAGSDRSVYSATVIGDVDAAIERLTDEEWVMRVAVAPDGGGARIGVEVEDPVLARRRMLRVLLADPDLEVAAFGSRRTDLEDVFVHLVGEAVT